MVIFGFLPGRVGMGSGVLGMGMGNGGFMSDRHLGYGGWDGGW